MRICWISYILLLRIYSYYLHFFLIFRHLFFAIYFNIVLFFGGSNMLHHFSFSKNNCNFGSNNRLSDISTQAF